MQVQFIPTSKQVGNYPPYLTVPLFQALRSGQKHKAIGFLMPGPQSQSRADVQWRRENVFCFLLKGQSFDHPTKIAVK
jgi:hypothetical protein